VSEVGAARHPSTLDDVGWNDGWQSLRACLGWLVCYVAGVVTKLRVHAAPSRGRARSIYAPCGCAAPGAYRVDVSSVMQVCTYAGSNAVEHLARLMRVHVVTPPNAQCSVDLRVSACIGVSCVLIVNVGALRE
jgi:hypothetical protein